MSDLSCLIIIKRNPPIFLNRIQGPRISDGIIVDKCNIKILCIYENYNEKTYCTNLV